MAVLEVRGLRVRYASGGPEILKGVSFQVESDDFLAIIGPSGAGKSTLIRCVNRLVEPSSGSIRLLGEEIMKLKIGRASCRERVCQYVSISVVAGYLKKKNKEI